MLFRDICSFKEKVIDYIRLKGRVLGIMAGDREVLCTKNVLLLPQEVNFPSPLSHMVSLGSFIFPLK